MFIISKNRFGETVIANKEFKKGDKILDFDGKLLHRSELPTSDKIILPEEDRYLQISEEYFLGPSGKLDDIVNHSCDPNSAAIVNAKKACLIAIKDIHVGEEIVYDYSTLMFDEDWTMECDCRSINCRKIIKEYRYLPADVKRRYTGLGIVPDYNLEKF